MTKNNPLTIYIDARCFQDPNYAHRGIGRHCSSVLRNLRQVSRRPLKLIGIIDSFNYQQLEAEFECLFDEVVDFVPNSTSSERAIFLALSPLTHNPNKFYKLFSQHHILTCAIFYDYIPYLNPDKYLATASVKLDYYNYLFSLIHYDHFFPISNYVGEQLNSISKIDKSRITMAGAAIGDNFLPENLQKTPLVFTTQTYYLVVGGGDRRKNIEVAIRAHAKLANNTRLIIIGHYGPLHKAEAKELYKAYGGDNNNLIFASNISDSEMPHLFKHAIATICPSYYEGFSLPVAEGSMMQCPVLASNCDAQNELLQDDEVLFDPDDHARLQQLMQKVKDDQKWRAEKIEKQKHIGPNFTGEKVSSRIWEKLDELTSNFELGTSHPDAGQDLRSKAPSIHKNLKPKIALVTPWPSDMSGVADYSYAFASELAKRSNLDIYTDANQPRKLDNIGQISNISLIPYLDKSYDKVISVIGNSQFHFEIFDLLYNYGGVCIEHDVRLLDFYYGKFGIEHTSKVASNNLGYKVAPEEIAKWINDLSQLKTTFLEDLTKVASPLIVHSKHLQQTLNAKCENHTQYLSFSIYRETASDQLTEKTRAQIRLNLGIQESDIIISTFGIVALDIKAPDICIKTISLLRDKGLNAKLIFAGASTQLQINALNKQAKNLGIQQHVSFLGNNQKPATEQEYQNYLIASDFAIQLRRGNLHSLSGALLDCISFGIPTVANKDLTKVANGPNYIIETPDKLDPQDIANKIFTAYNNGQHLNRLSKSRELYLQEHSFVNYVDKFMKIVNL